MLLSVVIPTRNRASFLRNMLFSLQEVLAVIPEDYEVVISDNHSQDDSLKVIRTAQEQNPRLSVFQPPLSYDTAEENLRFAISQATGDYVWLLGDDDIPDGTVFQTLVAILRRNNHDFILYNSRGINNDGVEFCAQKVPCTNSVWDTTLRHFIVNDGFIYTLAGFSTVVFRRSELDLIVFEKHLKISKIYSQVMAFAHCFSDKPFLFVNLPLVKYRRNQYAEKRTGHWESYAKSQGHFERYYWTTGLIDHFNELVNCGKFSYQDLYSTIEQTDNSRYRLIYWMLINVCQQIRIENDNNEEFTITQSDIQKVITFIRKVIPGEWYVLDRLQEIHQLVNEAKSRSNRSQKLDIAIQIEAYVSKLCSEPVLSQFFVSSINDRNLYFHDGRFFFTKKMQLARSNALDRIDYQFTDFVEFVEIDQLTDHLPYYLGQGPTGQGTPEIVQIHIPMPASQAPSSPYNDSFTTWVDKKLYLAVRAGKKLIKRLRRRR